MSAASLTTVTVGIENMERFFLERRLYCWAYRILDWWNKLLTVHIDCHTSISSWITNSHVQL